jgi:hypothetical protein
MKSINLLPLILIFIFSCTSGNQRPELPAAVTSNDAVIKGIKGKKFKTDKLALLSNFMADKNYPYEWFSELKDTSAFFKNYETEQMKRMLQFTDDTSAVVTDKAGDNKGTWKVTNESREGDVPGSYIRITFVKEGEPLFPGQTGPSTITYAYRVIGLDEKSLLVETPNMFNNKKVVALMKTE